MKIKQGELPEKITVLEHEIMKDISKQRIEQNKDLITTELYFEEFAMTDLKGLRIDIDDEDSLGDNEINIPKGINVYTEDKGEEIGGHLLLGSIPLNKKEALDKVKQGLKLINEALILEDE